MSWHLEGLRFIKGKKPPLYPHVPEERVFAGIDGEGQTDRDTGRHRYIYLACVDEQGNKAYRYEPRGLSTHTCLDFITRVPPDVRLFAFSFGYDITKILEDLNDMDLYRLMRPELRRRVINNKQKHMPIYYPNDIPKYRINYLNGRLSVARVIGVKNGRAITKDSRVIHDIFRFFACKFTEALKNWKIPVNVSDEERERILENMRDMKDKRSDFDKMDTNAIFAYCNDECNYMAQLARKLDNAHRDAGIPLRSYFGAGSSASSMLKIMGVHTHVKKARLKSYPAEMEHASNCAFFGGRFENAWIGRVEGPLYSDDLSSAYPYQIRFLPCLMHGTWEKTSDWKRVLSAKMAVVHYRLHAPEQKRLWAPFPFRYPDGTITYPEHGQTGWIWKDEFIAGQTLFPNVEFLSAWVWHSECECDPFEKVPQYYLERLKLGKEAAGLVLKLAMNSIYGKMAQYVGGEMGPFTSRVWAGIVTSGCRAQILEAMAHHTHLNNLLMIATDGIVTREDIPRNVPRDTGTHEGIDEKGQKVTKPLGGWERKTLDGGIFLGRPGIYFPLGLPPKESKEFKAKIKQVKGRGLGQVLVYDHADEIIEAYESGKEGFTIQGLGRFVGAKTGISRGGKGPRDYVYTRSPQMGRWIDRPVHVTFNPRPKREFIQPDSSLELRVVQGESTPYRKDIRSADAEELALDFEQALEQPDGGDYVYLW